MKIIEVDDLGVPLFQDPPTDWRLSQSGYCATLATCSRANRWAEAGMSSPGFLPCAQLSPGVNCVKRAMFDTPSDVGW